VDSEIIGIFDRVIRENRKLLTVYEAKLAISFYGLSVTEMGLARDLDEALEIAHKIGFPVVLKIVSPDIVHKTDVGGVILNIKNEEELEKAYQKMMKVVKGNVPNARIDGILVEEMLKPSVEVIIGGMRDRQFGPVVIFGLGGIFVEVFKDISYGIAPLVREEALDMIKNTRAYKILKGYRGKGPYDVDAIADLMVKTSNFIWTFREYIAEMDLNPVFVYEKGVKIADARIVCERENRL